MSVNTDFNVLIMDEVFEGLDEKGENDVFDLIRMKANEGKSGVHHHPFFCSGPDAC